MTADVVVLGSANSDLVYEVASLPQPGETLLATAQSQHCGGKGLNQAIATARAGASTAFVGAVGDDDAGALLTDALRRCGIDVGLLRTVHSPTGTALITVDGSGENTIVVAAGANGTVASLTPADKAMIATARVLVMQLEIPLAVVAEAAVTAGAGGTSVVLNAAPAQRLDDSLLGAVDVLVVNEHEAATLTDVRDPVAAARRLVDRCAAVVVTLGPQGAVVVTTDGSTESVPALPADVVDTTGAGDTFTGYLAAGLSEGRPLAEALRRAVVAGAISVERHGAEPSIPTRAEVDARL